MNRREWLGSAAAMIAVALTAQVPGLGPRGTKAERDRWTCDEICRAFSQLMRNAGKFEPPSDQELRLLSHAVLAERREFKTLEFFFADKSYLEMHEDRFYSDPPIVPEAGYFPVIDKTIAMKVRFRDHAGNKYGFIRYMTESAWKIGLLG